MQIGNDSCTVQKVQAKGWEKRWGKKNEFRSVVLTASIFLTASPKVQGEFKSCIYLVMILFTIMKFTVFLTTFLPSTSLLAL